MNLKSMFLIGFAVAMMSTTNVSAQEDSYMFNHLAIGAELGTTGFGLEVATPVSRYATLRTGFTTLPSISVKGDVDYTQNHKEHTTTVKVNTHVTDWKLLADIYPGKNTSFHFTTGFYVGKSEFLTGENTKPLEDLEPGEGLEIGNEVVTPDENGIAHIRAKVAGFKPYLGIGFGRPVSSKKVSVAFDMGVQLWGTPKVEAYSPANTILGETEGNWVKVGKTDVKDDDVNEALDKISSIKVYPVLSLRVYFNAF